MTKSRTTLKVLAGLIAVLFALGLVACGATDPVVDDPDDPVDDPIDDPVDDPDDDDPVDDPDDDPEDITLEFLHIWPEHQETMNQSVAMFEDDNPHISVDINVVPWDEINRTLQTAFATGEAPDVGFMWPNNMGTYVSIGAAMNLNPYLEDDPEWRESFVSEEALAQGKLDGNIYAVPFRATATFFAYNQDMFDEYGWDLPETREEMEDLADAMLEEGITPFAIPGRPDGFQVKALSGYFEGHELYRDGVLDDPEYLARRKSDIEEPYARALEDIREWYNRGYFGDNPFAIAREEAQSAFFTERGAMLMANNNELSDMRDLAEDFNLGWMQFPSPADVDIDYLHNAGFDGFFVNADTPYPDESVELLKALTSNEVQTLWADEAMSLMVIDGIQYDDPDLQHLGDMFSSAALYRQIADYGVAELNDLQNEAFVEFMMDEGITPEELAQTYIDLQEAAIAEHDEE